MNKKKEALLKEMENVVDKYKDVKREEAKDKSKEEAFTKADMDELMRQMKGEPQATADPPGPAVQQQPMQLQQQQPTERQQIAQQIWKDQKALSIICLIAVVLPMIAVLITMAFGEMFALIIAFGGMIYPLVMFVKSMSVQAMLQLKYGFKPLFQFQQRRPMQQDMMNQPQQPKDKEEVML